MVNDVRSHQGVNVSFDTYEAGSPLLLLHGRSAIAAACRLLERGVLSRICSDAAVGQAQEVLNAQYEITGRRHRFL